MTEDNHYSEGVCADGAAILCDGVPVPIEEVIRRLNTRPTNLPEIAQGLVDELRELLESYAEAIEDIESWAAYASEYFQDKHDLEGCLAKHRSLLERHPTDPNLVRVKE